MFGRKKKSTQSQLPNQPVVLPCNHKWEDFDWYINFSVNGKTLEYAIFEPYVCIHCKERKDVILEGTTSITASSNEAAWSELEKIKSRYPKIKDRAIVEDEINDAQLVDREYIRIAKWLQGTHVPPDKIVLKIERENDTSTN